MFLKTLTLKNFRSHQETVLELDRFNFLRGPNGCGKSSIQMALEYLFTGRCRLTDGAGRGAEALIRLGKKEFEVSATFESGDTICRRRTARSQSVEMSGKRVPVDVAESLLTKHFGRAEVLSAVLSADRFVEMEEARQQKFLSQLSGLGNVELTDEIRGALRDAGERELKLASISDVEAVHEHFLDMHKEASRTLKALGQQQISGVAACFPLVGQPREKLEASPGQPRRLTHRTTEADICLRNAQLPSHETEAEMNERLFQIPDLWEEEDLLEIESPSGHAKELRRELADLTAERERVRQSFAATEKLRDKCPMCGQRISEAAKAKKMETLRRRLTELDDLVRRTQEELNCYNGSGGAESERESHGRVSMEHSEYAGGKSALETKLRLLERLIEFFGPNGAVIKEAKRRMEQFCQDLNQQLAAFGYTCNLTLEPFEIRVSSSPGGPELALKQLSESERFRFGIAFQIALAAATGIRLVVIDRADMLDRERRKLLTALLLSSGIEQAIVLATGEEPPPGSTPAGVRFLDLARTV